MLNKVCLIGNLGKDPEVRNLNNGDKVASFSLATSERWKDAAGQRKEKTEWHNIVVFNKGLVRVVEEYLVKGKTVYIEGKLQTRKWQDKNGNDRWSTEVVLTNFDGKLVMLGGGKDREEGDRSYASDRASRDEAGGGFGGGPREDFSNDLDDEIPF